jgi:ribosomal protein S18 acetylase RimI-like enzyme
VKKEIKRNYLEIKSLNELAEVSKSSDVYSINFLDPPNFQLNKFFYKNIGKDHHWVDRLVWSEKEWIDYVCNEKVSTYILRKEKDVCGYFELIFHKDKNEFEIAYFGLLKEYHNKKLGSFLLSFAIKKCFEKKINRVWVHTCSLDHDNALKNYLSRGMKIYKRETVFI